MAVRLMCMGRTHRIGGLYAGAGLAYAAHWPTWQIPAAAAVAAVFAAGRTSPDIDQYKAWRALDRWLPDEMLGHGGPLGHRRISHFWGIPAALAAVMVVLPAPVRWVAWAILAGWVSHLLLDAVWGRACPQDGRGPGIPLWLWWHHHGVGLDAGGPTEAVLRWGLSLAPAALILHVATS